MITRRFLPLLVLMALGAVLAVQIVAGDSAPEARLFGASPTDAQWDQPAAPHIVRRRLAAYQPALLAQAGPGDQLTLNLFDDVALTFTIVRVEAMPNGAEVWMGKVAGDLLSQVTLVQRHGLLSGIVTMQQAVYEISPAGAGAVTLAAINQAGYPPEHAAVEVTLPAADAAPVSPLIDDGSEIDVFVAYTAATRAAAGGTANIENTISLAIASTNQSYINSGVNQRLTLAGTAEVVYTESGDIELDLMRLQADSDGHMDGVHASRDATYADEVILLVENGGSFCGIAYLMTSVSNSFAPLAFGVVARTCAVGNYSFAHELGHNMGARHDWFVDGAVNSPYSFNKGYVNTVGRWRTIMAYNNLCSAQGFNCTRLQYWANPNVVYSAAIMGVSPGTSTNCTAGNTGNPACDADNRLTLNNTAYTVANFRDKPGTPAYQVYLALAVRP